MKGLFTDIMTSTTSPLLCSKESFYRHQVSMNLLYVELSTSEFVAMGCCCVPYKQEWVDQIKLIVGLGFLQSPKYKNETANMVYHLALGPLIGAAGGDGGGGGGGGGRPRCDMSIYEMSLCATVIAISTSTLK